MTERASPLGCCRENKPLDPTTSAKSDEYAPTGKVKDPPQQLHRWRTGSSVISLAASESFIYAGCESGQILVYDTSSYELHASLNGHEGSVYTLVLTPDRQFLFSGASDSLVKVWDLAELKCVYTIYSIYDIGDIFSAAWVPSQETLYFGAQNASIQWLKLYETSHTTNLNLLPSRRFNKFFDSRGPGGKVSPLQQQQGGSSQKLEPHDRQHLTQAQLQSDNKACVLLEVPPSNIVQYAHYGYVYTMLVTPVGGLGSSSPGTEMLITGGGDGTVKLWDCSSDRPLLKHSFDTDEDSVLSMTCSDAFLYCGLASGRVMMFDLDTLQMLRVDTLGSSNVMALAVQGDCLFRATQDQVSKWDPKQYNRGQWTAHEGLTLSSAVGARGRLVTGGNDATVAVWNVSDMFNDPETLSGSSSGSGSGTQRELEQVTPLDNENMIKTLSTFVSYKTVSGHHQEYLQDCRRCAKYLLSLLQHFGAESRLIPVGHNGNPIVYGLFKGKTPQQQDKHRARVLFYGHYDVIIASDADKWDTDPYKLTALDGYMYGRGASDNKGPIIAAIYAAAQLLQEGELTNDIVFIIEGEEENGSAGFQETILHNRDVIGDIDWVLLSNSYWLDDTTPCLNYGLRGILNAVVEIGSGKPDLHSGVHGGCFREPTMDMVALLGQLAHHGKVLVPGFYDSVRKLTAEEEELYSAIEAMPGFEDQRELLMKKWRYPSMTIHRISVSGPGNSTVIPATVSAQISLRIVPDQDFITIRNSLTKHLHESFDQLDTTNEIKIRFVGEADPWIGDPNSAAFQILRTALEKQWGVAPLFIREGGSIPVVRFLEKTFGAKAAQLPCGQASDGAHLDNERLRVTNFFKTRSVLVDTFRTLTPAS